MKKIIGIFVFFLLMLTGASALAASEVSVEFNCVEVEFDQPAIISENRTLVPVRKIFELLGADVQWDDETRTVTAEKNNRIVSITIGSRELYINDDLVELDVPAKIINNRTLVPLRAVSEAYECSVEWNGTERLVEIFDLVFLNSAKRTYRNEYGLEFEYFADCKLVEDGDNAVGLESGRCSMTLNVENSHDILIDDTYLADVKSGLKSVFSKMKIYYIRKITDKNILLIKCYNNGNTIYYMYANREGKGYNLAITIPEKSSREDLEMMMYVMKSFIDRW